jgi:hypothetical protein
VVRTQRPTEPVGRPWWGSRSWHTLIKSQDIRGFIRTMGVSRCRILSQYIRDLQCHSTGPGRAVPSCPGTSARQPLANSGSDCQGSARPPPDAGTDARTPLPRRRARCLHRVRRPPDSSMGVAGGAANERWLKITGSGEVAWGCDATLVVRRCAIGQILYSPRVASASRSAAREEIPSLGKIW